MVSCQYLYRHELHFDVETSTDYLISVRTVNLFAIRTTAYLNVPFDVLLDILFAKFVAKRCVE